MMPIRKINHREFDSYIHGVNEHDDLEYQKSTYGLALACMQTYIENMQACWSRVEDVSFLLVSSLESVPPYTLSSYYNCSVKKQHCHDIPSNHHSKTNLSSSLLPPVYRNHLALSRSARSHKFLCNLDNHALSSFLSAFLDLHGVSCGDLPIGLPCVGVSRFSNPPMPVCGRRHNPRLATPIRCVSSSLPFIRNGLGDGALVGCGDVAVS